MSSGGETILKLYGIEVSYKVTPPQENTCTDTIVDKRLYFTYGEAENLRGDVEGEIKARLALVFPKHSDIQVQTKVAVYGV